jgi:hypothetical protein
MFSLQDGKLSQVKQFHDFEVLPIWSDALVWVLAQRLGKLKDNTNRLVKLNKWMKVVI